MFAIYQADYEATSWARFTADLNDKMYVVLAHYVRTAAFVSRNAHAKARLDAGAGISVRS
jgi:hypothetical protein